MKVELTWFGTSTFRLVIGETVVFLDAYMDRVEGAPPVGLKAADVDRADFIAIGHSHFDHLFGAETIARNTGATIVGSFETTRLMADEGVPVSQLLHASGGEPVRLGDGVVLRVFPGLHSCLWSSAGFVADECHTGDLGVLHQDRMARTFDIGSFASAPGGEPSPMIDHLVASKAALARGDGGALGFLIDTPDGSIWWNDSSGYWSGIVADLRPDVAILAAAGRPNVDGEPHQGSLAGYVAEQAESLKPGLIVLCHHDNWMPPFTTEIDTSPIKAEVQSHLGVEVLDLAYNDPRPLLGAGRD
jgi:L-ascorbate metabolism protein UlaG (beta-lactamase superfamily)